MSEEATLKEQFSEKLGKTLLRAIEKHGGDPQKAVQEAQGYSSVREWRAKKLRGIRTKGILFGAFEAGVPFVGMFALVPDIQRLFGHSAYACWGVGELLGCKVYGLDDIVQIMRIWSDEGSGQLFAVSKGYANAANSLFKLSGDIWELPDSVDILDPSDLHINKDALKDLSDLDIDKETLTELSDLGIDKETLKDNLAFVNCLKDTTVASKNLLALRDERRAGADPMGSAFARKKFLKTAVKLNVKIGSKVVPKIVAKVSAKVAVKVGSKAAAHAASAVPFAGAVLGAAAGRTINGWVATGMLDAAEKYYSNPI